MKGPRFLGLGSHLGLWVLDLAEAFGILVLAPEAQVSLAPETACASLPDIAGRLPNASLSAKVPDSLLQVCTLEGTEA